MKIDNYSFLYQRKFFENFRIALINIHIDLIYIAKIEKFWFSNIVNTILTKKEIITILLKDIKTFF